MGVIEHFIDGPEKPLKELFRVLKHGGIAIVTVPSFNKIRQLKKFFNKYFIFLNPKKNNLIRKLFKKDILIPNYLKYKYHVCPIYGPFFEYRFRPLEFEEICRKAGLQIILSKPIRHLDGLFLEFGRIFCKFYRWRLFPNVFGKLLNKIFKKINFFHNHMHVCVLIKP